MCGVGVEKGRVGVGTVGFSCKSVEVFLGQVYAIVDCYFKL